MRVVIQRVSSASVAIKGSIVAAIGRGMLVLVGIQNSDTTDDAAWLAQKIARLRIFEDLDGKMNRSIVEVASSSGRESPDETETSSGSTPTVIVVSQFTLLASTRKGTRPSFNDAAKPEEAIPLYQTFIRLLESELQRPVGTGQFGARMDVSLTNDGPVTLVIDSRLRE